MLRHMRRIIPAHEVYGTSDLALAAVLLFSYPLDALERQANGPVVFVFRRDAHLDSVLEHSWHGLLRVEPQAYCQHIHTLQHRLWQKTSHH